MPDTISDLFAAFSAEYLHQCGDQVNETQVKVIRDILDCRSSVMGGSTYYCNNCQTFHYSYHSCKNRHCPKCQNNESSLWIEKQTKKLLPVPYHLVTFTVPAELRPLCQKKQRQLYSLFFQTAAASLQKLAADPKFIGGYLGLIAVLHTWSRQLLYHPHVHFIVPGGGYDRERKEWRKANSKFLFPVKALSIIFRAKIKAALFEAGLSKQVPSAVWQKDFVVHSKPVGTGESALKYLAQYVYRVAISNNRIIKVDNRRITFSYKESSTNIIKRKEMDILEFIRRFLLHILPAGFQKVRYYGFLNPAAKNTFEEIKALFGKKTNPENNFKKKNAKDAAPPFLCPHCHSELVWFKTLKRADRAPPLVWEKNFLRRSFSEKPSSALRGSYV